MGVARKTNDKMPAPNWWFTFGATSWWRNGGSAVLPQTVEKGKLQARPAKELLNEI